MIQGDLQYARQMWNIKTTILSTWKIMAMARPATATETVPLVATVTTPVKVIVRRAKLSIRHMNQR